MSILGKLILTKIIRVEPAVEMITLTWMIGPRCNYDCMYCPTEWHDQTSSHPELAKLQAVWGSIYNKTQAQGLPYKISFTGGEVTANKSFLPLIEHLRNGQYNIGEIHITTNGSASVNYYTRLAELVTSISFSLHSEFVDEQEFFNKVKTINAIMPRPERSVHVNIMNEFWNQNRIPIYQQWLDKHNISHSVNFINYEKQTRTEPTLTGVYNLEQV